MFLCELWKKSTMLFESNTKSYVTIGVHKSIPMRRAGWLLRLCQPSKQVIFILFWQTQRFFDRYRYKFQYTLYLIFEKRSIEVALVSYLDNILRKLMHLYYYDRVSKKICIIAILVSSILLIYKISYHILKVDNFDSSLYLFN